MTQKFTLVDTFLFENIQTEETRRNCNLRISRFPTRLSRVGNREFFLAPFII